MKSYLVIAFIVWCLLGPRPPGIAINPETKECGYFGYYEDEYTSITFPAPWVKIYGPTISTEEATCDWDMMQESAEKCCQQLGYKYIGD